MPTPVKARKKPRNQPVTFSETLAPASQYVPAAGVSLHLSERQQRAGLTIIWVTVMILLGIAAGWRIVANQRSAATPPPGRPIAQNPVNVAPLTFNPAIAPPTPTALADLTVSAAPATTQAAVGSQVTFEITVRNLSPTLASGLIIKDRLDQSEAILRRIEEKLGPDGRQPGDA